MKIQTRQIAAFLPMLIAWVWNVLIALDQLANTLVGGDPDETLSSRMGKAIRENRCLACRWVCWVLGKIDPGHCTTTIEEDEGKDAL